jgi:cell division protease FtsH
VPAPQGQPNSVPHNYGAPPDWRPATTPTGQTRPPAGQWQPPQQPPPQPWAQPTPAPAPGGNGNGHHTPPADQPGEGDDHGGSR